jgi:arginase
MGDVKQAVFSPDTLHPNAQNLPVILSVVSDVARAVDRAVAAGLTPVVVGGDCTITIGVLAGLAQHCPDPGMLYFDGDLDLNTPATSPSGIFDGMGLAHIIGKGADELSQFGPCYPLLDARKIALFGYSIAAGGVDPAEMDLLHATPFMSAYPFEEIQGGAGQAARCALREVEARAGQFVLHFDVDVVDSEDFPAGDVRHSPGLTVNEAEEALEVFLGSPNLAAVVVTEFNPAANDSELLAARLVDTLTGAMARAVLTAFH